MFFQAMVTVTAGNACATVDGLGNTVIAQLTPAPVLLRMGRCAVGEANASVGLVLAPIQGLQAKCVKNALSAVTLAVPGGNVLFLSPIFISSRYLVPILPQQCAHCHYCKLDLQTRTQDLLCPLRGVVITRTSTIYQHYFCTKELYGKQFNHLRAAQVKHHTSTAVTGCTTNQSGGLI